MSRSTHLAVLSSLRDELCNKAREYQVLLNDLKHLSRDTAKERSKLAERIIRRSKQIEAINYAIGNLKTHPHAT